MHNRRIAVCAICVAAILITGIAFWIGGANQSYSGKNTGMEQSQLQSETTPEQTSETKPQPKMEATQPPIIPVENGYFELPIHGATGFATIDLNLRSEPSAESKIIGSVKPGTAFEIIGSKGDYWQVKNPELSGYLAHKYCMINLSDVIPSIIYENTNASASKLVSSGKNLPGVTGQKLYGAMAYNERLQKEEFIMPVLYSTAKKICAAQQLALSEGNSLKIYEAYRPDSAQRTVVEAMEKLSKQDVAVRRGIEDGRWKVSWFISQNISHHQRGCAIDVSLVQVNQLEERKIGRYAYKFVSNYTEYEMPTDIHELSIAAAAFQYPVSSTSLNAWKKANPAPAMNKAALALQRYCADAGLTPLASEWWHFNDLTTYDEIRNNAGRGEYTLTNILSVEPFE